MTTTVTVTVAPAYALIGGHHCPGCGGMLISVIKRFGDQWFDANVCANPKTTGCLA